MSLLVLLLAFLYPSLALAEEADPQPLPLGTFVDQVLEPLAERIADEYLTHYKSYVTYQYAKQERIAAEGRAGDLDALFYRMLDSVAPGSGVAMQGLSATDTEQRSRIRDARYREFLAWLDTRRHAFKMELLDLYTIASGKYQDTGYAVCVDGRERRYETRGDRFVRLADAVRTCTRLEPKQPKSLRYEEGK